MRTRVRMAGLWLGVLCALALVLGPASAQASRPLVSGRLLNAETVPGGQVEGACGAVPVGGGLYVSEYYRHRVDSFSVSGGTFDGQIDAPNPLDGVCGLALSGGALYANEWHESVVRLLPSLKTFDSGHESTAVAVDAAGKVYACDRTYVAVYEPSGSPVLHEGQPLKIGLGHLGDAYGVAAVAGRVYVADAASESVKVFEPGTSDPAVPVATIDPGFTSLTDSSLTIDPTNAHLLVLDDLQPGYESPEAEIDEFDSSGILVDQITHGIVDGGPSGLTVDSAGRLFVTSGNSEDSNVLEFGPYVAAGASPVPAVSAPQALAAGPPQPAVETASENNGVPPPHAAAKRPAATASDVIQRGGVRVAVQAKLTPKKLPRTGAAPVYFSLSAKIASTDGSIPPQLRGLEIEINRHGSVNPAGLPACRIEQIQPATTKAALEACRPSLVGEGSFSAKVLLTQQAPFPSSGEVVAFNGRWRGKPAILAHIYGTKPVPTSYTLPFVVARVGKGTYGTALKASLPRFTSKWGYVTGISLNLGRRTSRGGYLTAGCPAPKGFGSASFPLARASLSFSTGPKEVDQTLTRSCGVR